MLVLSIDTSTKIGSVALYDSEIGILGEINLYVKINHSNIIMPLIDNLLKITNKKIEEIDKIGVVIGPGSFTGIRIGVAIAKGLCYGTDKKIVGINSLDLLAYNCEKTESLIVSMIDARKERVYYGMYRYEGNTLVRVSEYRDDEIREILGSIQEKSIIFVGDGAIANKELIEKLVTDKDVKIVSKANSIQRGGILAELSSKKEEDDLYLLEPYYISKSQAEREKER